MAYGNEMNIQFTCYSCGRLSCSQLAKGTHLQALCCMIKLHILGAVHTPMVQKDELLLRFGCSFK